MNAAIMMNNGTHDNFLPNELRIFISEGNDVIR